MRPAGYDDILVLKRELRRPANTLIALDERHDPFYIIPSRQRLAEWIAELWPKLPKPAHYRRIHYVLVSLANIVLPTGALY